MDITRIKQLGQNLCHYHSDENDPFLDVGSFLSQGKDYPDLNIVLEVKEKLLRLKRSPRISLNKRKLRDFQRIISDLDLYLHERIK